MFCTIWCDDAIFLQNLGVQLTLGEGVLSKGGVAMSGASKILALPRLA